MTSKKATVYILDSGPNMGHWLKLYEASAFQKSKDAIQQSLEEKVRPFLFILSIIHLFYYFFLLLILVVFF